jgi:outer membrane protein OmpA-like peptidoglycan-associated protein
MRKAVVTAAVVALSMFARLGHSQTQNPSADSPQRVEAPQAAVPVYRVTIVGRSTPAINYRYRSGDTPIDFEGTALLPRARGHAKVETKKGFSDIDAHFDALEPASRFGHEYLTYVMWAVTPEGRPLNLGEVLLNGDNSKLHVTTDLQAFGLIVTAEPYFAVSQPSDVVVLENKVRPDTVGAVEPVQAKYELLKRGSYVMNANPSALSARTQDPAIPLELREARNAVELSRLAGADRYARDTFEKAARSLQQAEEYQARDAGTKPVIMTARAAAQMAEDARLIALQRQIEQSEASARDAATQRELQMIARARADAERAQRAEAERAAAESALARAEDTAARLAREKAEAERASDRFAREKAEAEQASARLAQEKAEADAQRAAAERARADTEQAAQRLAQDKAQADAARAASEAEVQRARMAAQQAEQEKTALRERLQQQLNVILETRVTARGLIVNMSDVLFDTGKATLLPGAREKLAKVAGILLTHPDLNMEVEGHTDGVGAADYNQDLSERRAMSVQRFLIQQGIQNGSIAARGFGKTQPVATNGTAAGRQQNRRVELVVSGEAIGSGAGNHSR